MVVTPLQEGDQMRLLTTSEPVNKLARRFCMANRFYGSRILIGPRTFELSSRAVVALSIDFLTGVDVRIGTRFYASGARGERDAGGDRAEGFFLERRGALS